MIVVAILLPPLAVLLKGKPFQAVVNVFLTMLFWVPGMIHAILVVNAANADERTKRLEQAIRESAQLQTVAAIRVQQAQAEAQIAAEAAGVTTKQQSPVAEESEATKVAVAAR